MSRIRLGDMLVAANILDPTQLDEALAIQRSEGGRLGTILVELGYVSEMQLAQVLSNQLSIPWVNLYHIDFSRELLNLLPADIAEKYGAIPVYVRKVRRQGETLFVATDDPTNEAALNQIAAVAGMPVKPMVAATSDVRNAIRVYYFGGKATPGTEPIRRRKVSLPPATAAQPTSIAPVELEEVDLLDASCASEPPSSAPEADAASTERTSPPPSAAASPGPPAASPSEPGAPAGEASLAASRRGPTKKPRMITLTLLDGTTVRLPAPGAQSRQAPEDGMTTRDLIAALVARAEGKDVSAALPDARWEPLFAALLTLLLKKGLIADWEFVEEWSKRRS